MISIIFCCSSKGSGQETIAHVSNEVSFLEEAAWTFVNMGQELVFKNLLCPADQIFPALLWIRATFANPKQCILLCFYHLNLLDRGFEEINHVRVALIVDHETLNLFVANNAKGTQDDANWNRFLHEWDVAINCLTLVIAFALS